MKFSIHSENEFSVCSHSVMSRIVSSKQ